MITLLLQSRLARMIGLTALLAFAAKALVIIGKRRGVQETKAAQAVETVKAVQRGAEGAAEAKTKIRAGKTPQQIKDGNDAKWQR